MFITIDINHFADLMKNDYGFHLRNEQDLDGWTNSIVDILEEHYDFETILAKQIKEV